MNIIMLAGTGASGKSTLAAHLDCALKDRRRSSVVVSSTTRKTTQQNGLTDEKSVLDLKKSDDGRAFIRVQNAMLADYLHAITEAAKTYWPTHNYMIVDRSPYDYLGYLLAHEPRATNHDLETRFEQVREAFVMLTDLAWPTVWFLPAIPPWGLKTAQDGYRDAGEAKYISWNLAIEYYAKRMQNSPGVGNRMGNYFSNLAIEYASSTAERCHVMMSLLEAS